MTEMSERLLSLYTKFSRGRVPLSAVCFIFSDSIFRRNDVAFTKFKVYNY